MQLPTVFVHKLVCVWVCVRVYVCVYVTNVFNNEVGPFLTSVFFISKRRQKNKIKFLNPPHLI